jgi:hypothetical protein
MTMARWRSVLASVTVPLTIAGLLALSVSPARAQNRRKSWEIFIYFGEYGGQTVPSAIQSGVVKTYRLDPQLAVLADPNDITSALCEICRNAGDTGPGSQFMIPTSTGNQIPDPVEHCFVGGGPLPVAFDPTSPFYDECDDDVEAVYKYNRQGIVTNGAVERNDREFLLGARFGYNITNHWEVELDLGFAKQRLDMTRNLIPLLQNTVSNPADPFFQQSAEFYEFTWANRDFLKLGYQPSFSAVNPGVLLAMDGMQEIPNVPHRRFSKNPGADIPAVLPMPPDGPQKPGQPDQHRHLQPGAHGGLQLQHQAGQPGGPLPLGGIRQVDTPVRHPVSR